MFLQTLYSMNLILEISTANANLARQEKEIELKAREVEITERRLEAEVKKTADAQKYATQQAADAELYQAQKKADADLFKRKREAEAEKFEAEQKAEATKAESIAKKVAMENEAAGIEARGKAEAEAIRAKAEAEAAGILKKAEAMERYGEAAKMDMQLEAVKVLFEKFPAMAAAIGEGYKGVDKIVMMGSDSNQLANNIIGTTTQLSEGLSASLGFDLKSLLAGVLGGKLAAGNCECGGNCDK